MYRQDLIHTLAESPQTYSELAQLLHSASTSENTLGILNDTLKEVAEFRPPQGTEPGLFSLRKDRWAEFNPFFHRMSKAALARATGNAIAAGWDPASQLTQLPPPPAGLRHLYKDLDSSDLLK